MNIKTPWDEIIDAYPTETAASAACQSAYRQGYRAALESKEVLAVVDAAEQGLRALQDHVPLHHVTREILENSLAALERLRKEASQ